MTWIAVCQKHRSMCKNQHSHKNAWLWPRMPTKRAANSETRKNAATTSSTAGSPSVRPCIIVQDPPGQSRDAKTPPTGTDEGKKFFHQDTITASPTETPATNALTEAEQLMFHALKQLQEIYDASCKTKANKITIERATFEKIAKTFQQAYEQIKTEASTPMPMPTPENATILNALNKSKPVSTTSKPCKQPETRQTLMLQQNRTPMP